MKVVILCGGKGTRMDSIKNIPKPLVNIGRRPILWHIMKYYFCYGFKDFILCLGYKGEKIKEYFANKKNNKWNIIFVNTGENANKAERLAKIKNYINEDEFLVSYGDDVSNVNLSRLIDFHRKKKKIATITVVQINNPFGVVKFDNGGIIKKFREKPLMKEWINGGYMIFNKKIFDYIKKGEELEKEVFEKLVKMKEICAFKHKGFWKGMNTLKDAQELNELWKNGKAIWKIW